MLAKAFKCHPLSCHLSVVSIVCTRTDSAVVGYLIHLYFAYQIDIYAMVTTLW